MRGHDPIELELEKDDSSKRITALKIYLAYVLLGVVAFSYVLGNWDVSDSIWFSLTTLTSVGYGDLTPTTPELKAFTIFYILLSSVITASVLGLALGSLFEKDIRFAEEMGIEETSRVLSTLVTPQRRPEDQTENHNEEGEKQQTESPKEWTEMPSYRPSRPAWWPYSILIQEFTRLSALLLMGGFGYHAMEPESFPTFLDGVYFTAATASTVGYGDLASPSRYERRLLSPAPL